MAARTKKAEYAPPASQVDLEERRKNENRSSRVLATADAYEAPKDDGGRTFAVEDNDLDGYIGTNPEYQTYANETEAPLVADDSVEEDIATEFVENMQQKGVKEESDDTSDATDGERSSDQPPAEPPSGN